LCLKEQSEQKEEKRNKSAAIKLQRAWRNHLAQKPKDLVKEQAIQADKEETSIRQETNSNIAKPSRSKALIAIGIGIMAVTCCAVYCKDSLKRFFSNTKPNTEVEELENLDLELTLE